MRSVCYPLTFCVLLAAAPLTAQRMGSVNRNAPTAGCFIDFLNGSRIEVSYAAITLAEGRFMSGLESFRTQENKEQAEAYLERFNVTARRRPLGRVKVRGNITLGGKQIPAGDYGLAFMLDANIDWQVVLVDDDQKTKASWTLTTKAPKKTARRLSLWIVAGDQGQADLGIAFGAVASSLKVVAGPEKRPTTRRVRSTPGRRRR